MYRKIKEKANWLRLRRGNEKEISGVVIDAFTEPFVLPKDLWELLERIPSAFAQKESEE